MADTPLRANYALVQFNEHLGDDEEDLEVPWADFVGNRSSEETFTVPTDDVTDPYIGLQAFDVATYGHEIQINGESLSGFDIPPADGWQYWVDTLAGADLVEGENAVRFVRDDESADNFVVGTVTLHWKEPARSVE